MRHSEEQYHTSPTPTLASSSNDPTLTSPLQTFRRVQSAALSRPSRPHATAVRMPDIWKTKSPQSPTPSSNGCLQVGSLHSQPSASGWRYESLTAAGSDL